MTLMAGRPIGPAVRVRRQGEHEPEGGWPGQGFDTLSWCSSCRCARREPYAQQRLRRTRRRVQTVTPVPPYPPAGREGRLDRCRQRGPVTTVVDPDAARVALAAGRLACPEPGCEGRLRVWSRARARQVRQLGAELVRLRPDRARCVACGVTHVLLPA